MYFQQIVSTVFKTKVSPAGAGHVAELANVGWFSIRIDGYGIPGRRRSEGGNDVDGIAAVGKHLAGVAA